MGVPEVHSLPLGDLEPFLDRKRYSAFAMSQLQLPSFLGEILRKDLSMLNLIASDFAMLNRPLARHYGLEGPKGREFQRVPLDPEDGRGGLLTQASVLLSNSTGEDSHPIRRAACRCQADSDPNSMTADALR